MSPIAAFVFCAIILFIIAKKRGVKQPPDKRQNAPDPADPAKAQTLAPQREASPAAAAVPPRAPDAPKPDADPFAVDLDQFSSQELFKK